MQTTSLLPAQESHWELMCALMPDEPGRSRLNAAANRVVDAPLDEDAMRLAFADLTRRQEGLRLVFDTFGAEPRLHIEPMVDPPVDYLDLSTLDASARWHHVAELAYRENLRPFYLRDGPCWHASCVRLGPDRFFVNAVMSEIIADGWATKVFVDDLLHAYSVRIGAAKPAEPPLSYAEMLAVQRSRLEPREDRLAYWRQRLVPLPQAPSARPRTTPDMSVLVPSRIDVTLPADLLTSLRRLAWRCRTTVYMVLMAAYHAMLTLTTGRERTVVSTVMLSRATSRERRSLLPCSIDPYVVTTLPPGTPLGEAVRLTHESMECAAANMVPFTVLARTVNPDFAAERPWPDSHLCDGNFYSSAFGDEEATLSGLHVVAPPLAGRLPADRTGVTLRIGDIPPAQRDAWIEYCGPTMEVSHDRDAVALMFNGEMYPYHQMRACMDDYLWIVGLMASSPELTMRSLAGRYSRRLGRLSG